MEKVEPRRFEVTKKNLPEIKSLLQKKWQVTGFDLGPDDRSIFVIMEYKGMPVLGFSGPTILNR